MRMSTGRDATCGATSVTMRPPKVDLLAPSCQPLIQKRIRLFQSGSILLFPLAPGLCPLVAGNADPIPGLTGHSSLGATGLAGKGMGHPGVHFFCFSPERLHGGPAPSPALVGAPAPSPSWDHLRCVA